MIGVPMETVGWTLIAAYSERDAEQPVRQLRADYQAIQQEAVRYLSGQSAASKTQMWVLWGRLLLAMLLGALIWASGSSSR